MQTLDTAWLLSPPYTVALVMAAALLLAASYFQRPAEAPPWVRLCWGLLRLVAVVCVAALFVSPRLIRETRHPLTNHLWLVVDESRSMGVKEAGRRRYDTAVNLAATLQKNLGSRYTVKLAVAGGGGSPVKAFPAKPLKNTSALGEDLTALASQMDERLTRAVVLLSDGRVTHGPALESAAPALSRLGATVLATPLGSVSHRVDLSVAELEAPQVVAQGEPFGATFTVRRNPGGPAAAQATLLAAGAVAATATVRFQPQETERHLSLKATLKTAGFHPLVARITPASGETNLANNQQQRLVKATLTSARSLVLWGKPDPALGAIARALSAERGHTARGLLTAPGQPAFGGGLLSGPTLTGLLKAPSSLGQMDLLVLGEAPRPLLGEAAASGVLQAAAMGGLGVLWVYGATPRQLASPALPAPQSWQRSTYRVQAGQRLASLWGDTPPPRLQNWPPVQTLAAAGGARPDEVVLWASAALQGGGRYPLLVCQSRMGRQCAFYSPDLWRWFMAPQAREGERGEAALLMSRLIAFLTDREAPRRLVLTLEKNRFGQGERLSATAEAFGPDFQPLEKGKLSLNLRCKGLTDAKTFVDRGRVRYESPPLPPGPCTLTARAATPQGIFVAQKDVVVEKEDLELASRDVDMEALSRLAKSTGGKVTPPDELAGTLSAMKPKPLYEKQVQETDLARTPWPLALALLALVVEWAWRRQRGVA